MITSVNFTNFDLDVGVKSSDTIATLNHDFNFHLVRDRVFRHHSRLSPLTHPYCFPSRSPIILTFSGVRRILCHFSRVGYPSFPGQEYGRQFQSDSLCHLLCMDESWLLVQKQKTLRSKSALKMVG